MVSPEHRTPDLLLQWHLGSPIIFGINLFNDVFAVVSVGLKNTQLLRNVCVFICEALQWWEERLFLWPALDICGFAHSPSRLMHRQLPEPAPQVPWAQG